jgi:transcription-repair coupling factor (superfamily II helicase)
MKDLEIRGAGDLLGSQQSGNMESVGYEMYCKLLDEAVRELKGEQIEADFETLMDLKVNAFIPVVYISSEEQRLEMYKKIAVIKSLEDYYAVQEELEDRFGDLPKSVVNLLDVAYTKALAHKLGADKVSQRDNKVIIYFKEDAKPDAEKIMTEIIALKGKLLLTNNAKPYLTYEVENKINPTAEVKELLEKLL